MKPFFDPEPRIFARGWVMPDSLAAYRDAIGKGADVIAAGVRLVNRELVLYSDISREKIMPNGSRLLGLQEVLEEFPGQRFSFTIQGRDNDSAECYCDIIKKMNAADRVLSYSFYGNVLSLVRKRLPDAAVSFSLYGSMGFYALFRTGLLRFVKKFRSDALQIPEMIGPSYLASQGLVKMAHDRGVRVYVYSSNNESDIKRLSEAGVDGFIVEGIDAFLASYGKVRGE